MSDRTKAVFELLDAAKRRSADEVIRQREKEREEAARQKQQEKSAKSVSKRYGVHASDPGMVNTPAQGAGANETPEKTQQTPSAALYPGTDANYKAPVKPEAVRPVNEASGVYSREQPPASQKAERMQPTMNESEKTLAAIDKAIAREQSLIKLGSDRTSKFRAAVEKSRAYSANVFLTRGYNAQQKLGCYTAVIDTGAQKYIASLAGNSDDAFEYGFAGAIEAFEYIMRNEIREVHVYTEPELAAVLQQNINALMFGYSATRRKYVEVVQAALRSAYIEFITDSVQSDFADLAKSMSNGLCGLR